MEWSANSKVGSIDNIKHKPGGGNVKVFDDIIGVFHLGEKSFNTWELSGGSFFSSTTHQFNNQEKHDSTSLTLSANVWFESTFPLQILDQKIELKVQSKVGSLDNVKHRPGGGDKKVFNDVDYLRQMSDTTGAQLMAKSASGGNSQNSSRRESAVQV